MPDDGKERELIKRVTLTDGRVVDVRMPLFSDILPAWLNGENPKLYMLRGALSISLDEVMQLNVIDGTRLLEPLNEAVSSMFAYADGKVHEPKEPQ